MRILSYNIRHGQGVGGVLSNTRIAKLIKRSGCDVAALCEVWRIPGAYDQPSILSCSAEMAPSFHSLSRKMGTELGNLLLSSSQPSNVRRIDLGRGRGCMVAEWGEGAERFAVAGTHLSLDARVRRAQLHQLAAELPRDVPLVLAGDFNCGVFELAPLRELLCFPEDVPRTYPSVAPMRAIDHIGYSRHWRMDSLVAIPALASDHLPLLAQFTLRDSPAGGQASAVADCWSSTTPARL